MYCGAICSEEKIEDNAHGLVHLILLQSLNWLKEEKKWKDETKGIPNIVQFQAVQRLM